MRFRSPFINLNWIPHSQWGHEWLAQATALTMKSWFAPCELPASRVPIGGHFSELQSHPYQLPFFGSTLIEFQNLGNVSPFHSY